MAVACKPRSQRSLFGINLSYGSQSSKSEQTQTNTQSQGSSITAGNNLNIRATDTDINVQGSHLQAGKDIGLMANRDVNLISATNTSVLDGKNESHGGSVGGGISTGGNIGAQFVGNMASSLLVGVNSKGSDSSTTQSAVSDGTIIIRDENKQTQNVAELSRDVEHANQTLSPIFDKEKEQRRLQEAQKIGEIGTQVMDIARTQGAIEATKAANEKMEHVTPEERENAKAKWQAEHPGKPVTDKDIDGQVYQGFYNKAFAESGFGTGGKVQRAIQAATAAVQGLAGSDVAKAVAGGSAPYIANIIGSSGLDDPGRVLAHAAVNAALAAAQGNNALVGATGAATAEMVGMIAANTYGKPVSELSETEKQTVSALATLAAGLAGGLTGDTSADAIAGAKAGQTTVENNYLSLSEKTELELAKQKLQNSKDPAERERAQQKINELREKDIASDQKVIDACGNGNAGSATCAGARFEVIAAKGEYENIGNYNSKASQQYADAYGQIVNLLNITSVDAQNQQQVKDAMVNYAMAQLGVDKATAEQYVSTYEGMKVVAASMTPVLGAAAANKISALGQGVVKESVPKDPNSSSAVTDAEAGGYSYYDKFKNANGGWDWPKNLGFEGDPIKTTIPVGTRLDRYGEPNGSFLAPKGTPHEQRALAPGAKAENYYEYEVIKPLPAIQGKIAPAFGEPGGGIQILPNMQDRVNVEWLLKNGYIHEVR